MKWIESILAKVSTPVQIVIVLVLALVSFVVLYFTGSLESLGAWLGAN